MLYLHLAYSGPIWTEASRNDLSRPHNWQTYKQGWDTWLAKPENKDGLLRDEKGGEPSCGKPFQAEYIGNPAFKRLMLKMLHPNPDLRISVHDALYGPTMRGIDCCSPESYEGEDCCNIDVSSLSKSKSSKKFVQKKHNHLPPKSHKTPNVFKHRFDMGDGYN
jgi:protein-serine/threonine kinase